MWSCLARTRSLHIHNKYISELLKGHLLPTTRDGLLSIVDDMRARDRVDAILLAATELPLLLTVVTVPPVFRRWIQRTFMSKPLSRRRVVSRVAQPLRPMASGLEALSGILSNRLRAVAPAAL